MSTSAEDAATRGNFTLDDYLRMVNAALTSERPARGCGSGDDASIETNRSAESSRTQTSAEAKEEEAPDIDIEPVPTLEGLGTDQLLDVLTLLSIADRARVHMTCRHLRSQQEVGDASIRSLCLDKHGVGMILIACPVEEATKAAFNKRPALSTARQRHALNSIHQSRELQWSRLGNLRELNVGKHCTDQFLAMISRIGSYDERGDMLMPMLMPGLEILRISESYHVTEDALLMLLAKDGSGRVRSALREVDVTFCSNITYSAVIQFRTLLPNCLLRRLPDWLCGHTHTPFGDGTDEVHTYWPDGTFSYNREQQSEGFVMRIDMLGSDPNHVSNKLQFIDFDERMRGALPSWFERGFLPSVSLLRLENEEGISDDAQHVLVAQRKEGIKRLKFFPKVEQAQMVPLGSSRHFDLNGNLLEDEVIESQERTVVSVMVSHMRKKRLQKEEHFSPFELVAAIASYLEKMKGTEVSMPDGFNDPEDLVHLAMLPGDPVLTIHSESDYRYDDNMVAVPLDPSA